MPHLTRDGIRLAYLESGSGAPPLVLLHGVACNAHDFDAQIAHFAPHHRAVAMDFRGHGESDAPDQAYTIPGYADDVIHLCHELGIYQPVIIGHSLGGCVALEIAAREPNLAAAIVMLDSPVLVPESSLPLILPLLQTIGTAAFGDAFQQFTRMSLGPAAPAALREEVLATAAATPAFVSGTTLGSLPTWDATSAASACQVPALYVDFGTPNADLPRLQALCPQLAIVEISAAGHWSFRELPDQVNAAIESCIARVTPAGALH